MKVHIGKEIEKKFQQSGLKITSFAETINTGERNVYTIFKREDINAELLFKISEALNFDFFSLYQNRFPAGNIFKESQEDYVKKENRISINLTLSIFKSNLSSLSDFINDITPLANKNNIKLI